MCSEERDRQDGVSEECALNRPPSVSLVLLDSRVQHVDLWAFPMQINPTGSREQRAASDPTFGFTFTFSTTSRSLRGVSFCMRRENKYFEITSAESLELAHSRLSQTAEKTTAGYDFNAELWRSRVFMSQCKKGRTLKIIIVIFLLSLENMTCRSGHLCNTTLLHL